jgi:predicted HTH transcriptional regulator
MTDGQIVSRMKNSEDSFVERKSFGDWKNDVIKTVVGFANSCPPDGEPGLLVIGVRDTGEIEDGETNFDSLQMKLHEQIAKIYPPIPSSEISARVVAHEGRRFLAVVVRGSRRGPHFAGPAYVRNMTRTDIASTEQFSELIAQRGDKPYEILKWKGRMITIENVLRTPYGSSRSFYEPIVEDCDSQRVKVRTGDSTKTIPLSQIEVSFDDDRQRLKLEHKTN